MKLIRGCLLAVVVFGCLANAQIVTRPQKPYEPPRPQPKPQEPQRPHPPTKPHEPQSPHLPTKPHEPQRPHPPTKPHEPESPHLPTKPQEPQRPHPPTKPQEPQRPHPPTKPHEPQRPHPPTKPQEPQRPHPPTKPQEPQRPHPPTKPHEPQRPHPPTKPQEPQRPHPPTKPQEPQRPHPPTKPHEPQRPHPPTKPQEPQRPHPPTKPQEPQRPHPPTKPQEPQRPHPPTKPQEPQRPHPPTKPQEPQRPHPPTKPQEPQRPHPPTKPHEPQRPHPPTKPHEPQRPHPPTKPQEPQRPHPPTKPHEPQRPHPHPKPQEAQKPHPHPKPQEPLVPKPPEFHSCEIEANERIQCGAPGIGALECDAINCCFDGHMCYYGKYVTLQCTKGGYFIVVVSKDATLPSIDTESIYFYGDGDECRPVGVTSTFLIYMFRVTACGTVQFDEPDGLLYENRMYSSYEISTGYKGQITRDTTFDVVVQCRYIGSSIDALVIEVNALPSPYPVAALGPIRVEIYLGSGQCTGKGCVEEDVAFNSYYSEIEYPIRKVLRDPVYVEVALLERTDPNLVLTLGRCWATSGPYPHSYPQWDLVIDGCPNHEDKYLTRLLSTSSLPYPGHSRRFIFWMFTFMTERLSEPTQKIQSDSPPQYPSKESIYIHCSTSICIPTPLHNCEPRCLRTKREIAASAVKKARRETIIVSSKAIEMRSA